ncbi:nucleoside phosphorylase domain-containing protein [Aspergillus granulosus]|uniref:Nucleoside phosphorylase domain-containing protein n=1 Tax=Aspergillus granulosus TaxID=176169 RepID=A0ABR4GSV4_9EURO
MAHQHRIHRSEPIRTTSWVPSCWKRISHCLLSTARLHIIARVTGKSVSRQSYGRIHIENRGPYRQKSGNKPEDNKQGPDSNSTRQQEAKPLVQSLNPGSRNTTYNAWGHSRTTSGHRTRTHSLGASSRMFSYQDYTVGWICALAIELAAAKGMLDEVHTDLPARKFDDNTYILGRIGSHNIVITCLPAGRYGAITAATVATRMLLTFQSIRFGLMVGIGGGVPIGDIRLGDIVVGMPTPQSGGVLQCDAYFERTSTLNKPPVVLLNAVSKIKAQHIMNGNRIPQILADMLTAYPLMRSSTKPAEPDKLFHADYEHKNPPGSCSECDERHLIARPPRNSNTPRIHYGPIASANQVVKSGILRDHLARRLGNLCFEMEAAGLMDNFPCLVIRGISDYADSHKNDHWQGYAAATAAAYAKELLSVIPPEEVENELLVSELYSRL